MVLVLQGKPLMDEFGDSMAVAGFEASEGVA